MLDTSIITPQSERLYSLMNFAMLYYRSLLDLEGSDNNPGWKYMRSKGISVQILTRYSLGYAVNGWDLFMKTARKSHGAYSHKEMELAGLLNQKVNQKGYYDVYRGRVMVPCLHPVSGQCLGFLGRLAIDKIQREEKDVFPRDIALPYKPRKKLKVLIKESFVFGLYQANEQIRRSKEVYIVSHYMEVLTLAQAGISNVVSSCGIPFTLKQALLLKTYTNSVIFVVEDDQPGFRASSQRVDVFLAAGLQVSLVAASIALNPDQGNVPLCAALVEDRMDYVLFKATLVLQGKLTPLALEKAIESLVRTIRFIPDALRRDIYITQCADGSGLSKDIIRAELRKQDAKHIEGLEKRRRR